METRILSLGALLASAALGLAPNSAAQSQWGFNLPTSHVDLASGGFRTGFEAGVLPPEMATTAIEVASGLPSSDAWCQIGVGVWSDLPFSGTYEFELGFDPYSAHGWTDVRNALVIGFDGSAHSGAFSLEFEYLDQGDDPDLVDGIWLSQNGVDWHHVVGVDGLGNSGLGWSDWSDGVGGWGSLSFDLAAAATAGGLSLGGNFYVAIAEESGLPYGFFAGVAIDAVRLDPDLWVDLGGGLAGTHGIPSLVGSGPLTAGASASLTLTGALELAPVVLVLGTSQVNLPILGGTLIPSPDAFLFGFMTSASGDLVISALWPPGIPVASTYFFQCWITDPLAPQGFSASSGVLATPP